MKCIMEYVWIDAAGGMRSKNRVANIDNEVFNNQCILSDAERWDVPFGFQREG